MTRTKYSVSSPLPTASVSVRAMRYAPSRATVNATSPCRSPTTCSGSARAPSPSVARSSAALSGLDERTFTVTVVPAGA